MTYPLSASDFPPLADLSLNDSHHRPASRRPTSHVQSPSVITFSAYQMQGRDQQHLSQSGQYQSQWSVPGWQSTLYLASDSSSVPPIYSHDSFETPSSMPLPYTKSTMESLFLPRLSLPELDCELPIVYKMTLQLDVVSAVSASPSDTCSSIYSDLSSSSPPPSLHVVCDIPVVAPRPLPYHSPTFLQFDLPDVDEDLSHPPYTRCPSKRKRKAADDLGDKSRVKRQAPSTGRRPASHLAVQRVQTTPAVRRQQKR